MEPNYGDVYCNKGNEFRLVKELPFLKKEKLMSQL